MPNFKVTATMDVGYTAIIEAENEDEAWAIARGYRTSDPDWEQTDNGHDWTLENIWEVDDDEVSQAANDYDVNTAMDYINFSTLVLAGITEKEMEAIDEKIRNWELEFHPLNETQRGFMRMHEAHHLKVEKFHAEHKKKVHEIQDIIALDWTSCEQGQMGAGKDKLKLPEPVPIQKHKANPPRSPFASETQSIKGHKSRK